jgi:hypothetical protein
MLITPQPKRGEEEREEPRWDMFCCAGYAVDMLVHLSKNNAKNSFFIDLIDFFDFFFILFGVKLS